MATSKSLRTPPPRVLDNYVVSTKKTFSEPRTVPDAKFYTAGTYAITFESAVVIGGLDGDEGYSVSNPIGFDLQINGKTYREFSVAAAGWMMLRDPDGGSTGANFYNDIIDASGTISTNQYILPDFLYDHILLAPWFDGIWITSSTVEQLKNGLYLTDFTPQVLNNIATGADTNRWPYDSIDHGVRYVNGYDSKAGKYLLVRWTSTEDQYNSRLKFEVAVFENGKIEYRYWPRLQYTRPAFYGFYERLYGTVGAFWSGPSMGSNKFRDLSTLLDYNTERALSEYGGASYSASYSETSIQSPFVSRPYSVNVPTSSWPLNGAVITLSPPVNPGKFLPRKIISSLPSTKDLVPLAGLFDDRKTLNFVDNSNVVVHMPSTLPSRLIGNTSSDIDVSLRQLLFTSGSLQVTSSMRKHVVNSQLEVFNSLERLNAPFDFSFNESQKSYQEVSAAVDGFYATGSALEIFGDGFTAPLKSKTQFHFSLPITKQVTMPPASASLYYYDSDKKSWALPNVSSNPKKNRETLVAAANSEAEITQFFFFLSSIYRVTENSILFDAVGRKTVSGSFAPDIYGQSASEIGAIFNKRVADGVPTFRGGPQLVGSAISEKYRKSVTDDPDFYPQKSQMISFPADYPFLIEKIVVDIPLYISGGWFEDRTTCNKAFGTNLLGTATGHTSGAIDFGGPGLTFAIMCPRKGLNNSYMDLIASGTITSVGDNISGTLLYKNPGMSHYFLRPIGFKSFSNPTTVLSGTNNVFHGTARLELESSIAGGLTIVRNDRSLSGSANATIMDSNRQAAVSLLTNYSLLANGGTEYNTNDRSSTADVSLYLNRSPRVYIQQISPLSRGASGLEFNGNSILGGTIANYNQEDVIKNPLYYSSSGSLSSELKSKIDSSGFTFESVMAYSLVDSRPSPYLMLPGDNITVSISKTRPVIYSMSGSNDAGVYTVYNNYALSGSHGTVALNTGSIEMTVYGSYVKEGMEYHP